MVNLRTHRLALRLIDQRRISVVYDTQTKQGYRYVERHRTLDKYQGRNDVFGSFTQLPEPSYGGDPYESRQKIGPKLGINPGTKYNTPVGVYCYPITYLMEKYDESSAKFAVPFAGNANYLYIFYAKDMGRVLEFSPGNSKQLSQLRKTKSTVSEEEKADIYRVLLKISNYLLETYPAEPRRKPHMTGEDYEKVLDQQYKEWYPGWVTWLKSEEEFRKLNLMAQTAILKTFDKDTFFVEDFADSSLKLILEWISPNPVIKHLIFPYEEQLRDLPEVKNLTEKGYLSYKQGAVASNQRLSCDTAFVWNFLRIFADSVAKWADMMVRMGFVGAVDNGTATIHPSEPTQAVFFNLSSIKVIDVIDNRIPKQHKDYGGKAHFLLGQKNEDLERNIKKVSTLLNNEFFNLAVMKSNLAVKGHPVKELDNLREPLMNILKCVGWLNLHATDHDEWSPLRKRQTESAMKSTMMESMPSSKEVKDLCERIMRSIQRGR